MNKALIKNNKVDNIIIVDETTDKVYLDAINSMYDAVVDAEGLRIGEDYPKAVEA